MLPSLHIALPACTFGVQLNAAFGINAVLPSTCASGCDAATLMQALESV
jgi:hypothetical protein